MIFSKRCHSEGGNTLRKEIFQLYGHLAPDVLQCKDDCMNYWFSKDILNIACQIFSLKIEKIV